jgi:putative oxidoreductase
MLLETRAEANVGFVILRVFLGCAFMVHGYGKVFLHLSQFAGNVSDMGIPFAGVLAPLAAFSEFFGGLLLVVGLFTRVSSFFLMCTMLVAAFWVHRGQGFGAMELALVYLCATVMFMLKGAGTVSLDYLFFRKRQRSRGK